MELGPFRATSPGSSTLTCRSVSELLRFRKRTVVRVAATTGTVSRGVDVRFGQTTVARVDLDPAVAVTARHGAPRDRLRAEQLSRLFLPPCLPRTRDGHP